MHLSRTAAMAVALIAVNQAPPTSAQETTPMESAPMPGPVSISQDGWRPAKDVELVAAQSPDDDLQAPTGPVWSYPSRRGASSVPVPTFHDRVDYDPRASERLASRTATARSRGSLTGPRSDSLATASTPQQPPPLPTFHGSPFDRAGPACPVPPSCPPCQVDPFEDPCAWIGNGGWSYTADNIYFFGLCDAFHLDGEDTRLAARLGLNWGLPIFDDSSGWGFQIGFSGSAAEGGPQWFVTSGVFYRGDAKLGGAWNAGAVFDWMQDADYNTGVGQIRGKTSIALDAKNEIGLWGAFPVIDDHTHNGDRAEPVDQVNLFYRYLFDTRWDATGWIGWRQDPESLALGGELAIPLNDYWAGVVGGYYAFKGDTWNVFTGLVYQWGPNARQDYLGQHRHQPYLPVADNTSMTLFLHR